MATSLEDIQKEIGLLIAAVQQLNESVHRAIKERNHLDRVRKDESNGNGT